MVPATALPGRLADMLGPPCFQHASPHEPAIRPAIAATCTRSIEPILPVSRDTKTITTQSGCIVEKEEVGAFARRALERLDAGVPFEYPTSHVAKTLLNSPIARQRMAGVVGLLLANV